VSVYKQLCRWTQCWVSMAPAAIICNCMTNCENSLLCTKSLNKTLLFSTLFYLCITDVYILAYYIYSLFWVCHYWVANMLTFCEFINLTLVNNLFAARLQIFWLFLVFHFWLAVIEMCWIHCWRLNSEPVWCNRSNLFHGWFTVTLLVCHH